MVNCAVVVLWHELSKLSGDVLGETIGPREADRHFSRDEPPTVLYNSSLPQGATYSPEIAVVT